MASGKRPREIDDTERARSMPEAEATALSTVAMTMFLSVLAEAEAAKRQQLNALQPDETTSQATPPPPAAAAHAVTAAPADTSPPSPPEQPPADGATTGIPTAQPEFASLVEPSHVSGADRQQIDSATTATAWHSADHGATTSGFVPDLQLPNQIDSAGGSGLAGTSAAPTGHLLADPAPNLSFADSLQDTMARLTTTISDIGVDLHGQLASVTSTLSNLTTTIASDLSDLSTTISETFTSVTQDVADLAASVPATVADVLVSGVFGSGPQSPAPDTPDHNIPMLDTSGIVPVSFDHAPLHLGFLGQPHVEGHDPHDGAFSALGLH